MSEFLFNYQRVDPTTWVYLASLLSLGLFFKFNRFWSVRNLDLVLLILLAPGLLLVHYGRLNQQQIVQRTVNNIIRADSGTDSLNLPSAQPASAESTRGESVNGGSPTSGDGADVATPGETPSETTGADPAPETDTSGEPPDAVAPSALESDTTGADTGTSDAGTSDNGAVDTGNAVATERGPISQPTNLGPVEPVASEDEPPSIADLVASRHKQRVAEQRADFESMQAIEFSGFLWLIIVNALLVVRLLVDPNMVRRPLLEPNLSSGGLTFICVSLFVFLMANVIASAPTAEPTEMAQHVRLALKASPQAEAETAAVDVQRPGYILLMLFPQIPTTPLTAQAESTNASPAGASASSENAAAGAGQKRGRENALVTAARCIAIISHLAIVLGIATVGYRHFDSLKTGIGAATLYLMLPYTAQMTGHIEHSIPAALLVWAVVFYRRPATAGVFLGLSMGCYYYPLFLLPLWISFYWQRGLGRFLGGILSMIAVLVALLMIKSADATEFFGHVRTMFGAWAPLMDGLEGVWGLGWDPWYRVPVLAFFIGISSTLAIWPAQKNLGTLISCSGAVMVATQFWHGFGGGIYMGWFLPLLLLTIFRPNLEDRIALSVLGESWFPRRKRIAA